MVRIMRSVELELRPGGTVRFEGEPHGSALSFFHVKNAPGAGPRATSTPTRKRGSS